MAPSRPLPYSSEFQTADEYITSLLNFSAASTIFQTLCGGVHILDFFTREPSLYHSVIPAEWREWLMSRESMDLLDLLMRDDLSIPRDDDPPESLIKYIKEIRLHSLDRSVPKRAAIREKMQRHIAVGMIPKKIHEVENFADYVVRVADSVSENTGKGITHFVDFGSGQNYLGRTLASPPYNKHIVAVESKELNITGAKSMDVLAGVAEREKVMRNKKIYRAKLDAMTPAEQLKDKAARRVAKPLKAPEEGVDLRPIRDLKTVYTPMDGKGYIQYVEHVVKDGDLSDVVEQIQQLKVSSEKDLNVLPTNGTSEIATEEVINEIRKDSDVSLMAISIHSCGNLSHHGIRSLLLNPTVKAIAIVGCCYNLLTERLSPPTTKHPLLRPNLRPLNPPPVTPSTYPHPSHTTLGDPHGFPMSSLLADHPNPGLRLNITARMMAVQAPQNWTARESESFFKRHFYRALLQKVFLDYGVVSKTPFELSPNSTGEATEEGPESTQPIIIGSLRKSCYSTFVTYVRGALEKLKANEKIRDDGGMQSEIEEKMEGLTDEGIMDYERRYECMRKELSIAWSLMAFSAGVVESLIVVDRWLWLREQDEVGECWVEAVWEYGLSPRNLVVVGVKR